MSFRTATVVAALIAGSVIAIPSAHAATNEVWTGQGDGSSWSQAANWSSGVPQAGDSVTIAPPGPQQCYAHVVGAPQIALANLTLTENGPTAAPCLASVTGAGFTVSGTFTWNGGVLDAATTLLPGSTGSVVPTVDDRGELTENLTVQGTLTLQDNTYDGVHDPDRSVELQAGTSLIIAPGGVLNAKGTNTVDATSCCVSPGRIVNNGRLNATGSLTLDDVELDQNGVLDVVNATDEVVSLGAPNTAGNGAQYTGAGDYRVTEASGLDTLTGTQTLGPDFRFVLGGNAATSRVSADGNESLHGTFTFAGSGEVDWLGGELAADLTIGHGVRMIAAGNVVGGDDDAREITDVDNPYGGGAAHPARLTNHGALNFSGGAAAHFAGNSRIINAADGALALAPATALAGDCCSTQGTVVNQGGAVSVPAGDVSSPVTFDGVRYAATGGSTTIGAGQTLALTGGADSLLASTVVTGGTLRLAAPVRVSKTVTVHGTALQLRHGSTLEGVRPAQGSPDTATLTGSGALSWVAGTVRGLLTVHLASVVVSGHGDKYVSGTSGGSGPGQITVAAPLSVETGTNDGDGADVLEIDDNSTLLTTGTTTMHGQVHVVGGHLLNRGALTVAAGKGKRVYVTGGGSVTNAGTVNVTSGTLALDNSYLQSAGRTVLATGAALREIGSSSTVRLTGGSLGGSGVIYGSTVLGAATLAPTGFGTLTVHGDVSMRSTSVLAISVSRARRGQLSATGRVSLTGHLRVTNAAVPHAIDRPVVATAGVHLAMVRLCTTTTGAGAGAHHWQAAVSGHHLVLRWVAGRRTSC